jgi:hypothetical protein
MGIVDDLLAHPGLYLGIDRDTRDGDFAASARILVTPLPGGSGVALDYETINPATPDRIRPHHEHAILARGHDGVALLVTAHSHADSIAILRETEPGAFELGDAAAPFPMKITMSVPEPGRLIHSWWYGRPGEVPEERDRAELQLQPS